MEQQEENSIKEIAGEEYKEDTKDIYRTIVIPKSKKEINPDNMKKIVMGGK